MRRNEALLDKSKSTIYVARTTNTVLIEQFHSNLNINILS